MPKGGQPDDGATEPAVLQTLKELKSLYRDFIWESQVWARVGRRRSPYRVMVLFGLSARTKDRLLVETCRRFFHRFPDPSSLLEHWPARDAPTQFPAQFIIRKGQLPFIDSLSVNLGVWGGEVPRDKAKLINVVGVGEKIAECVLAYGWGIESLPMDGNGCRMYQRLMCLPDVAKSWNSANIRDRLKAIFHERRAWMEGQKIAMVDIHELFRLHAQLVCGRSPECQRCPVTQCLSRRREFLGSEPPEYDNIWRDWRDLILEPGESGELRQEGGNIGRNIREEYK